MKTKYYISKIHRDIPVQPYVLARGELLTEGEIKRYRLMPLVDRGFLEEYVPINGTYFWFGFRFEKDDKNMKMEDEMA